MLQDTYSLDVAELFDVIDDLARGHDALCELTIALERHVRELHLTWEGQAAQAHGMAQAHWDQCFTQMRHALDRMRQAAATAHRNYTSAAVVNRDLWQQVR